jgi:CYTH domain-containing protein
MRVEIERRFLVRDGSWKCGAPGEAIRQGYLGANGGNTVRVRRIGTRAYLTIKGMRIGNARPEFEYEIPVDEADAMLATLCPHPLIEKTRYAVVHGGLRWHVDVFAGAHKGLVIAECELTSQDQRVALPAWIGAEITGDPMYGNSALARVPKVASAPGI